ncbi:hypothetical protein [Streptomyces sp. BRA346]
MQPADIQLARDVRVRGLFNVHIRRTLGVRGDAPPRPQPEQ